MDGHLEERSGDVGGGVKRANQQMNWRPWDNLGGHSQRVTRHGPLPGSPGKKHGELICLTDLDSFLP
jgi:hypothetical protein